MDSYDKAAAIGGAVGGAGALGFLTAIAIDGGTVACINLGPAGLLLLGGVGIGRYLGRVAKFIFN